MWAIGALAGFILGVFSARLLSSENRRSDAWRAWIDLNSATRTGDRYAQSDALGLCEQAFRVANVPRPIFDNLAITSGWYVRWFEMHPPNSEVESPDLMYALHQMIIEELNRHLSRKWWHPPLRSRRIIQEICLTMAHAQNSVEALLQDAEREAQQAQHRDHDQPESSSD